MTEPRQDALPVSDDVAQIVARIRNYIWNNEPVASRTETDDYKRGLKDGHRLIAAALDLAVSREFDASLTTPAAPAPDMRHLLATAIFDSENTARLTEHPDELDYYLRRADALIVHMKTLGIGLAALQLPDAKPTFRDGIEAAAKVAKAFEPRTSKGPDEFLSACEAAFDITLAIRALATDHG